jgi:hypothetical protein
MGDFIHWDCLFQKLTCLRAQVLERSVATIGNFECLEADSAAED